MAIMRRKIFLVRKMLLAFLMVALTGYVTANGQSVYERVYATSQTSGGSGTITNPAFAVDNNLQTASKISGTSVVFSQSQWQELTLPTAINRSIPLNIKFSTEIALGLVGGSKVTLQAYDGNAVVGVPITLSSGILGLIGGVNMLDYQMSAPGGTGTYNKIRITLDVSGVAASSSVNIYEAYYTKTPTSSFACNSIVDYLYGVTGASLASGLNEVSNPQFAVDRNKTTFSTLRANVSAAASVFETALYNATSKPGDSIKITFKSGTGGLLDLSLLSSNLNVAAYKNNTLVTTDRKSVV